MLLASEILTGLWVLDSLKAVVGREDRPIGLERGDSFEERGIWVARPEFKPWFMSVLLSTELAMSKSKSSNASEEFS